MASKRQQSRLIFINWAPSVSSLRSITIIIITRSSSSIISIITSLTITKLTSSWSSSSASSSSPTAEPRQTTSLSGFLLVINSHHIRYQHLISITDQAGIEPLTPLTPPMQKGAITKTIDLSRKWPHPNPPTPKAWFIKDCGVQPPLILLTKGKLSWLRPAFAMKGFQEVMKRISMKIYQTNQYNGTWTFQFGCQLEGVGRDANTIRSGLDLKIEHTHFPFIHMQGGPK